MKRPVVAWSFCTVWLLALSLSTARATEVVPPRFEELVNEADYIVRAEVARVRSEWVERPSGRRIYSWIELNLLETIAGSPPAQLELRVLGGAVGTRRLVVHGAPVFSPGEEHIFFVQGNGRQIVPLVAMSHGDYRVVSDPASQRRIVTRADGQPLLEAADVVKPMGERTVIAESLSLTTATALSPEQFIANIRTARTSPDEK